jgi:hypothetical protein
MLLLSPRGCRRNARLALQDVSGLHVIIMKCDIKDAVIAPNRSAIIKLVGAGRQAAAGERRIHVAEIICIIIRTITLLIVKRFTSSAFRVNFVGQAWNAAACRACVNVTVNVSSSIIVERNTRLTLPLSQRKCYCAR